MQKVPAHMRETISENIRELRKRVFPGHGGSKKCAVAFGVSQQQWSPWERGSRTPDGIRLEEMASFFKVPVEYFYEKHADPHPLNFDMPEDFIQSFPTRNADNKIPVDLPPPASERTSCPHCRGSVPGQPSVGDPRNRCGIAERISSSPYEVTITIRLKDPNAINFILEECMGNRNLLK